VESWYKTRSEIWNRWNFQVGWHPWLDHDQPPPDYGRVPPSNYQTFGAIHVDGATGRLYRNSSSFEDADENSPRFGQQLWYTLDEYANRYWSAPQTWPYETRWWVPNNQSYEINLHQACEDDVAVGLKVFSACEETGFAKTSDCELANLILYKPIDNWDYREWGFGVDIQHSNINDGSSYKLRWKYFIKNIDGKSVFYGNKNPDAGSSVEIEGEYDASGAGEVELRWEVSATKYRKFGSGGFPYGVQYCWDIRDIQLIIKFGGNIVHESDVYEKHFHEYDYRVLTRQYGVGLNPMGVQYSVWQIQDFWFVEDPPVFSHWGDDDKLESPFLRTKWYEEEEDPEMLPPEDWEYTVQWSQPSWYFEYPEVYTEIL
tara:strand:+ start:2836 stop:3951 length:1116 start_codon:yes stop_codon:yes gene_type:complete